LTSQRVVLVYAGAQPPLLARVRAELANLGLTVVARDSGEPLEVVARSEAASAAIRAVPNGRGVEVWMADVTSGRTLLRQLVVDENPAGPDHNLIALQTAELMRTSLAPSSSATAEEPATPTAKPEKTSAASPPSSASFALQAALGPLWSLGGTDAAFQVSVSIGRSVSRRFGVALDASLPLRAAELSGPEGTTRIGLDFVSAVGTLQLHPPQDRWFAAARFGLGVTRIHYQGEARAPLIARGGNVWSGIGYAQLDAGVALAPWLNCGVRGMAGSLFNRVELTFAGNSAGSYGPLLFGVFGVLELPLS